MDRYIRIAMIGKGTFGSAWLVESKLSGYKYAIKELSARSMTVSDRHLALNEVKILSTLKHKNIIRYKNAFEEESNFYIVMEYAEGGDLYSKIKQSTSLFPQEQVLDWFTQLLLALKHIHGLNILHRDLKTQNIFLTRSDVIKLGDFGIARILDSTTDHAQTTVGTPYYLSPEICQRQPYNQKSDMWALGCVMYEITSLKHPFTADCFSSLVVKILHGKYTPIPSEYGPLLEDLIAVLLRSNPNDRPSAKQLLFVPAMKKYVEKYAVMAPRGKINSTATEPNQSQVQNRCEEAKTRHLEQKSLDQEKGKACEVNPRSQQPGSCHCKKPSFVKMKEQKNLEQMKSRGTEVERERSEYPSYNKSQHPESHCKAPSNMIPERLMGKIERANGAYEECREKTSGRPVEAIRKERRAESASSVENWNRQYGSEKSLARPVIIKKPAESSVANSVKMSILKEHQKQRHCSADSGVRPVNVEINSNQDETKVRYKTRSERIYSDVRGSSKSATGIKRDCIQDKTKHRKFIGVNEFKIKPKISQKSTENNSWRKKSLNINEVPLRRQRRSCSAHTHARNERDRNTSPGVERKKTAGLLVSDKDDSHSSDTDSSDSDEGDLMANITTQPHDKTTHIKPHYDKDGPSMKSRDRTASTPCGSEARARRRVARESLNYHMYHCRRLRAKSTKSTSSETLYKENACFSKRFQSKRTFIVSQHLIVGCLRNDDGNLGDGIRYRKRLCREASYTSSETRETWTPEFVDVDTTLYPATRQKRGCKELAKEKIDKTAPAGSQDMDGAMVESTEFKRCQTYKVAHFRRLPLMSVPDATRNIDTEVGSGTKINQSSSSGRHKSDSTFVNPKMSLTRFHGLKAAHIDRARRRAKRMSVAADVGSSRREFSVNPDSACAAATKHSFLPNPVSNKLENYFPCAAEEAENDTRRKENEAPVNNEENMKTKFKFRGQTLRLNTTDAKSAFAHMEALRVFLEENLGTRRFIDAYQYLNDSVFLSEKEKKLDCNIQHIMGKENLEYLPLLHQLIASETSHFGMRV